MPSIVSAASLTDDLEVHLLSGVSTGWQTVTLDNNYTAAIPICSYNLVSFSGAAPNYNYPPAVTRIRNITANSFELRIQGWEDSAAVTGDVHCLVTDTGAFTLPDGQRYEARTVLSDQTTGAATGWSQALLEDVSGSIVNTYSDHVVLGQVMSYNDNLASVFYTTNCNDRRQEPYLGGHADGICVGKHIGQINGSRNPETIGYLVSEKGAGTVNGIAYSLARGTDTVLGNNAANNGYVYPVAGDYTVGVVTQVAEDGGNGSWGVLYGADPLPANQLVVAVDEEIVAGDTSRGHTTEILDYWIFGTAELTLQKQVINDNGGVATETDFKLGAFGPDDVSGITGTPEVTDTTVTPGTYNLDEGGPSGYTGTWSCTGATLVGATLTVNVGDDAVCTLVNDDIAALPEAHLTLEKMVINDNGGTAVSTDFTLSFDDGAGVSGFGVQGDAAITSVPITPGLYKLTEFMVAGYALLKISCNGLDADGSDGLTIADGEIVICTFVNDDQGIDLEVGKSVSDPSPNVGDVVTFFVKVVNNGPDTATDLHVRDIVQAGFVYVAGSVSGGDTMSDASPAGTGLDWGITTLASGSAVILSFQATVTPP